MSIKNYRAKLYQSIGNFCGCGIGNAIINDRMKLKQKLAVAY